MRLVDRFRYTYGLGDLGLASQTLLELDEWADSVGAGFLFVQQDECNAELWLYGSYKAQWSWLILDPKRSRSQHQAQQVTDDKGQR